MNKKEIKAALADTKEKLVIWAVIAILGLISEVYCLTHLSLTLSLQYLFIGSTYLSV